MLNINTVDNPEVWITRPHPCRSTPHGQTRSRSRIEKCRKVNDGVNVEDIVQIPKVSHCERLKAVKTTIQYFEQGALVMDLIFLRLLHDETANAACSTEDNGKLGISLKCS
ncbi:hypothetical protein TNCV_1036851 [Trichonephila clavipes]|nr:hypothetical protein TNCV_1036851 [Trichonephila clavipes]